MNFVRLLEFFTYISVFCYFDHCHARALPYLDKGDQDRWSEARFIETEVNPFSTGKTLLYTSAHIPLTPRPSSRATYSPVRVASETLSPSPKLQTGSSSFTLAARNQDSDWQPHTPVPIPLIIVLIMLTPCVCFVVLHHIHAVFKRCQENRKARTNKQIQPLVDNTWMKTREKTDASVDSTIPLVFSSRVHRFPPKDDYDDESFTCEALYSSSSHPSFSSRVRRFSSSKAQIHFDEAISAPLPNFPPRVANAHPSNVAKLEETKFNRFGYLSPSDKNFSSEWVVSGLFVPNRGDTVTDLLAPEAAHITMRYK